MIGRPIFRVLVEIVEEWVAHDLVEGNFTGDERMLEILPATLPRLAADQRKAHIQTAGHVFEQQRVPVSVREYWLSLCSTTPITAAKRSTR